MGSTQSTWAFIFLVKTNWSPWYNLTIPTGKSDVSYSTTQLTGICCDIIEYEINSSIKYPYCECYFYANGGDGSQCGPGYYKEQIVTTPINLYFSWDYLSIEPSIYCTNLNNPPFEISWRWIQNSTGFSCDNTCDGF